MFNITSPSAIDGNEVGVVGTVSPSARGTPYILGPMAYGYVGLALLSSVI